MTYIEQHPIILVWPIRNMKCLPWPHFQGHRVQNRGQIELNCTKLHKKRNLSEKKQYLVRRYIEQPPIILVWSIKNMKFWRWSSFQGHKKRLEVGINIFRSKIRFHTNLIDEIRHVRTCSILAHTWKHLGIFSEIFRFWDFQDPLSGWFSFL